jgi:hypothetical protein
MSLRRDILKKKGNILFNGIGAEYQPTPPMLQCQPASFEKK